MVHATPGSISLEHDSFHITQVAVSDLSGTTASPSNLAASDIISSRAKFDGKAVVPDKPEAATYVM